MSPGASTIGTGSEQDEVGSFGIAGPGLEQSRDSGETATNGWQAVTNGSRDKQTAGDAGAMQSAIRANVLWNNQYAALMDIDD